MTTEASGSLDGPPPGRNPAHDIVSYPDRATARDAWILARRPLRNLVADSAAYAAFVERELGADGVVRDVAAVFITNRECPYRCLMCDLWKNTLTVPARPGAVLQQINAALSELPAATTVKLYNAGSFFDPRAIPPDELPAIAARLAGCDRIIVECHPAFVGPEVARFRDLVAGRLEIAMGLEVADDALLDRLNKRMTLASYAAAARKLGQMGVAARAFVLVQPPFVAVDRAVALARDSARFAFAHGAGAVSLIPVRGGNGALDALAMSGDFAEPTLDTIEDAFDAALGDAGGRVFLDTWDLRRFSHCGECFDARAGRMIAMNLTQQPQARVRCAACAAPPLARAANAPH